MAIKLLLIGSGGREHALATKFKDSQAVSSQLFWPGGVAFGELGAPLSGVAADAPLQDVVNAAASQGVDLIVVGPEQPLAAGITDTAEELGLPVFGPNQFCAQLESSKAFAKEIMKAAGIPTASYQLVTTRDDCHLMADAIIQAGGTAVLKASGLAGGKGVFLCTTAAELDEALTRLYDGPMAGAASQVVIEQFLEGRECSYFCFVHGDKVVPLGFSVDFKRLKENDVGPNTGGMGSYCPVPWLPADAEQQVLKQVVRPLIQELDRRDESYCGFLYTGLMWHPKTGPQVVEFNVRMGDPETQSLAHWDTRDWGEIIWTLVAQPDAVDEIPPPATDAAVAIVMASKGYPYGEGEGAAATLPRKLASEPSTAVFYASVKGADQPDQLVTGRGRVMAITAKGATIKEARAAALAQAEAIHKQWPDSQYRRDIAELAAREQDEHA